jgi:hypothetical protein
MEVEAEETDSNPDRVATLKLAQTISMQAHFNVTVTCSGTFKAPPFSLTAFPQEATPFAFSCRASQAILIHNFIRADWKRYSLNSHTTHNSHAMHIANTHHFEEWK